MDKKKKKRGNRDHLGFGPLSFGGIIVSPQRTNSSGINKNPNFEEEKWKLES
jgi:hypothetical protein